MPNPQNLRSAGDRIEQLLDELEAAADPRSLERAEELLRLVSDLYSAGLERVVELAGAEAPGLLDKFAADDLVASLLLVSGLHPEPLEQRVEGALTRVRPLLASHGGDVELLDVDEAASTVRLRLLGSCDGCPSSAVTLSSAVEQTILEAAPEIGSVELVEPPSSGEPVPVLLGEKPTFDSCPAEGVGA